jgi:histone acetyltransferase (RNA polymerase elongator complex component)
MYDAPFAASPLSEVSADIGELASYRTRPRRIFLAGGNAFHLDSGTLLRAASEIGEKIPEVESIGCFARVEDVAGKSDEELESLVQAGFDMISIGAESGDDEALARMRKGHASSDIVEQCSRLDDVGMRYAFFYLAGIAGKGHGIENAHVTSEIFSKVNPAIIMVHTTTPFAGTPLAGDIERGDFQQEPEVEILHELREFYALYPKPVRMLATHYANTVHFDGLIPEHREQILELMDECIEYADEERLEEFRRSVRSI